MLNHIIFVQSSVALAAATSAMPEYITLPFIAQCAFAAALVIVPLVLLTVCRTFIADTQKIISMAGALLVLCGIHQLFTVTNPQYALNNLTTMTALLTTAILLFVLVSTVWARYATVKPTRNRTLENNRQKANTAQDICITTTMRAMQTWPGPHWQSFETCPVGAHVYYCRGDKLILAYQNAAAIALTDYQATIDQDTIEDAIPCNLTEALLSRLIDIANGYDIPPGDDQENDALSAGPFCFSASQTEQGQLLLLFWQSPSDITSDSEAQPLPQYSQTMVSRAINGSIAGVYIYAADRSKHVFVNERYTEITGYAPDYIARLSTSALLSLVHEDDRHRVASHFTKLLQSNDQAGALTDHIQYRFRHANGYWVWLLAQDVVFERTEHAVTQIMGSFLDITPIRNMQEKLQSTRDEAHKASLAKSAFMANMSHEIRTPMNAVLALTDMVLKMELGGRQREYLNQVHASSRWLLQILNDILDYSKLEANKLEINSDPFDLFALLSEVMQLFTATALQKGLDLRCEVSPTCLRYVEGDHVRLRQILTNLLGNALKFTEQGFICLTVTTVKRTSEKDYVVSFNVRDTGIGIAPNNIAPLFAPFSQADSSISRQYGGSGLGLTICKRLAQLLNGDISVSSKPDEGSEFTLSVPLKAQANASPESSLKNKRVTLFSDIDDNVKLLKQYCARGAYHLQDSLTLSALSAYQSATDFLIIDISSLTHSQCKAILSAIFTHSHNTHVEAGIVVLSTLTAYSDNVCDVILNLPSRWVCHPLLPSDLERAMLDLLPETNSVRPRSQALSPTDFTGSRVLVVEDNAANQYVARELLQTLNITVDVANSGACALAMFKEQKYDIVLMDIQMPGLDGFETATAIRRLPDGGDVPVIALSAAAADHDRQKSIEAGMDAHIAKPIDINILESTLKKWLIPQDIHAHIQGATAVEECLPASQHLDSFDIKKALARIANDTAVLRQLLSDFYHQYKDVAQKGGIHIVDGMPDEVTLHTLKGLSEAIGATNLSALCAEAMRESEQSAHTEQIEQELIRVISCIRQWLTEVDLPAESDSDQPVPADITRLQQTLEAGTYISTSETSAYHALLTQRFGEEAAAPIVSSMHNLDYSQALNQLQKLINK